ncbi:MAG: Gfo/Idh/MocA family oxidoreductase [Proteobacteria bacterium]|nr:Gfo/Idh/MocA family oxidoreductase [Pseudomonadota bacterium]
MARDTVRCALVGLGYWGPNVARNLADLPDAELGFLCDRDTDSLQRLARRYPQARTSTEFADVLKDGSIDAVFVATPPVSHFELTMAALGSGRHVFVEKPLTTSSAEAERLIDLAERQRCTLMVDHIFVYSPAVAAIREVIGKGDLGQALYYDSTRINLGIFQRDVNVVWDLAIHDMAIMDHLFGRTPTALTAIGRAHLQGQRENLAYLTFFYADNFIAHVHVNWLAPVKIRRTLIGGTQRMVIYDDLDLEERVRVVDKGAAIASSAEAAYDLRVNYRSGDIWAPRIGATEALHNATAHFIDCIRKSGRPTTGGSEGLRVVKLLEAADRSLAAGGRPIEL